jgi:hypothetical protein
MAETTWRKSITEAMAARHETWADVVAHTLTAAELDEEFDAGFGVECGKPFTLWTKRHVYFPIAYDGLESVGSVPRDPSDEKTEHLGGG